MCVALCMLYSKFGSFIFLTQFCAFQNKAWPSYAAWRIELLSRIKIEIGGFKTLQTKWSACLYFIQLRSQAES